MRAYMKAFLACAAGALLVVAGQAGAKDDYTGPPVTFAKGANCWRYHGKASSFRIHLMAGQRVHVSSFGEVHGSFGEHEDFSYQERKISFLQPPEYGNPSFKPAGGDADEKTGVFTAPVTADYDMTMWPKVMWGLEGLVAVCKS